MPQDKDFLPVYRETMDYAMKNGEMDPFRASLRENLGCRKAIEESIKKHFDGMHFDSAAVKEVLDQYGESRTKFVLAVTIQDRGWDGRFSSSNKEWAKSFNIQEDSGPYGRSRRADYVVSSHPTLIDAFISDTRKELARKPSVLGKLKENADLTKKLAPSRPMNKKEVSL